MISEKGIKENQANHIRLL